jgi:hypothetical protein
VPGGGPAGQGLKLSAPGITEADHIGAGGHGLHRAARRAGHDGLMAKPPDSTKTSCRQKLAGRARERWPQLSGIDVHWHASSPTPQAGSPTARALPLMRLQYTGSAAHWDFAIYRASHDDYDKSLLPTGLPFGTPQEALACACALYLGDPTP